MKHYLLKAIAAISLSVIINGNIRAQDSENINNNQDNNELEEISVISSRSPVPLNEVIGSVSIIKSDDIDNRIVNNISDLVENTIGVSVPREDGYGRIFNEGFRIRGLGGKRVNILIDGVRIPDSYVGYGRDVVDVDLVKRVEILKAPSSALYGSDGLAGAVSYTTKDASDLASFNNPYYSATTSYNSANTANKMGVLTAFVGDSFEGIFQITRREMNERKLHHEANISPNEMSGEINSVLAKIKFLNSEILDLTLTADVQEWNGSWNLETEAGFSFFPTPTAISSSLGEDEGNRYRFSAELGFNKANTLFDNGRVTIFHQDTEQEQITNEQKAVFLNGIRGRPSPFAEFQNFQFNQKISGASAEFFKEVNSPYDITHQIVYGLEYEKIDVERPRFRTDTNLITGAVNTFIGGETYPNKTFPDSETIRKGIFISDRIELTPKASIVLGARYDSYDLNPSVDALFLASNVARNELAEIDDGALSAKFGFIYDLTNHLSLFAQYAQGFRSPDYESANISFTNFAFFYSVAPNPNLEAEESEGYEIGIRGNSDSILSDSSKTNWSVVYYENDYSDFIEAQLTGRTPRGIAIYQYVNLNEVTIKGFEAEFRTMFNDNYSFYLGYSHSEGDQNGEELISIDPDQAIVGLSWFSDTNDISINGFANIVADSIDGLPPVCGRSGCNSLLELPGRVTFDLFANADITNRLNINLAIRNITDKKHYDWASVNGKSENDAELDLFLDSGRTISASVKYVF